MAKPTLRALGFPLALAALVLLLPIAHGAADEAGEQRARQKPAPTANRRTAGKPKKARPFVGWIKLKTDDTLVVRMPDGPPPRSVPGEIKTFERNDDTEVAMLRSSWDELAKGDRVMVYSDRDRPGSARRIVAILRGGEKPLPPGLATRLFDPRYDESVEDVDGIGEVPPGTQWPPEGTDAGQRAESAR
jgi:hypothetical protein